MVILISFVRGVGSSHYMVPQDFFGLLFICKLILGGYKTKAFQE